MRRLFIYYRVEASRAAEALPAVRAFQQRMGMRHPGLRFELLRRPEEKDGLQTWMETYFHPDGVSLEVQADLVSDEERALIEGIQGNLYVEVFVPCAS